MKTVLKLAMITMVMYVCLFLVADTMAIVRRYDSNDVPKDIPDPGTVYSSLTVPDSFVIKDVNVVLDITHTYDTDLSVYLVAPDGTQVELFTDVGGGGDNFESTILDDEAARPIIQGHAPFTGSYQPKGKLSDFDGRNAQGTWQLKITDTSSSDSGVLNSWSLLIEPCPLPPTPTNPNPPNGATNLAVNTCLSWGQSLASPGITWNIYLGTDPNALVRIVGGLTERNYCPGPLEAGRWYYWRVEARNICQGMPGPIWSFKITDPPVARCLDVTVSADKDCQAVVTIEDIDWQSYDPEGGAITLKVDLPGPYPIGVHNVTLTVSDNKGASANCTAIVMVLPTAYCYTQQAIDKLWFMRYQDPTSRELSQAIDWLNMSLGITPLDGAVVGADQNHVVWAGPDRIAHRQGGFAGSQVFEFQQQACTLLKAYIQNGGFAFADHINEAWQLLAETDKKLAEVAISDAIFHDAEPTIVAEAKMLKKEGDLAKIRGGREICNVALPKYEQAWQKAIDSLGPEADWNRDGKVGLDDFILYSEKWLEIIAPQAH